VDGEPAHASAGPAALEAGGRTLPWVDLDGVRLGDHRIDLETVDGARMTLSHLARAHDRFVSEMLAARAAARRAALLQWAGDAPLDTYVARMDGEAVPVHLFADGLTVEPVGAPPVHAPLSLVRDVERDGYTITLRMRGLPDVVVDRLGRRTDEFLLDLERARTDLTARTAEAYRELSGALAGFGAPDGWAVGPEDAGAWWSPLRAAVHARAPAEMEHLERLARSEVRYGIKRLAGADTLTFCLARAGELVAVEGTGEQARATYVFRCADVDRLNVALLAINFRRDALHLPEERLGRWRLAVRTLEVVRWARTALVARIPHDGAWADKTAAALA
jgi:hypothetical protein